MPLTTRSLASSRPRRTLLGAILTAAIGCAPSAATPTPSATPVVAASPTIMQTCPSASDGPSIVVNAVEDAHRALVTNPSTPLPPPCVLSAFARLTTALPDSLDAHAIGLATELARRGGNQRELRESEVLLYSRAHRYADVSRA